MKQKTELAQLISDTHGRHTAVPIKKCKILLHAGDFSNWRGSMHEGIAFLDWMGSQDNAEHKVLVAGNHDTFLKSTDQREAFRERATERGVTFLHNESVEIDGLKIFGTPYSGWFGNDWAFNASEEKIAEILKLCPHDTDLIVSHGPPFGVQDMNKDRSHCGSLSLTAFVLQHQINVLCGHIHESYGQSTTDRGLRFWNAAIWEHRFDQLNRPIMTTFDALRSPRTPETEYKEGVKFHG